MAPPDPIIGLNEAYQKDDSPHKVIIGVGAYRDDKGKPYVLPSVRIAEERMLQQHLDMEYSGIVRFHSVIVLFTLVDGTFLQLVLSSSCFVERFAHVWISILSRLEFMVFTHKHIVLMQ
jgi:hypothetical protein